MKPVLVVHRRAAALVERLEPACPNERFVAVDRVDGIADALATHAPEVVFCIKSAEFVGPAFTELVRHDGVRWVNVGGSGIEHLGPWDRELVTVTNSAGVLAPYLAETWVGAVLALEGGLLECDRNRSWSPRRFSSVRDQRLLIVGLGEIGGRVATLAGAMGMQVEGTRQHPDRGGAPAVFAADLLDDRLPHADVVSLHARLTDETRHMFDAERFARMKPGALFVNTARGGLVDEPAMIAALESGHLRGAYLDVFETEPLDAGSPLWKMDNVLITPHAADQVTGWDLCFVDRFVEQLARWRDGEALHYVM